MRRPGAPAAALLLLALALAGCKPSSLTPFGLDWKEPETATSNVNGTWDGRTANAGEVRFVVGNNIVDTFLLKHNAPGCSTTFTTSAADAVVTDGTFSFVITLDEGQVSITGSFSSSTTCTGSYDFSGLPLVPGCPTADAGTFTATKSTL